jgi:hypothetical protein
MKGVDETYNLLEEIKSVYKISVKKSKEMTSNARP